MKLSIAMMVKNEEKHLRECLESLAYLREKVKCELIIVDTGSTDSTINIAKEYADAVYFHEWNNDFSAMRNITIDYCKGEWILIIDGDEVLENGEDIVDFLKSKESSNYNAAMLTVKNFLSSSDNSETAVLSSPRIFRNDGAFRYDGVVHNQPVYSGRANNLKSIILHYGYINDDKELMERKFKRTSALLMKELELEPHNIYYLFQLSVSYNMHGDSKKSLEPILKSLELVRGKSDKKQFVYVYLHAVRVLALNKEYKKALQISQELYKIHPSCIDNMSYMALCYIAEQQYEKAVDSYKKHIALVDNYKPSDYMEVVYYTMGIKNHELNEIARIYNIMGNRRKALEYLEKIKNKEEIAKAYNTNIGIYISNKEVKKVYDMYEIIKDSDGNTSGFIDMLEFEINKYDDNFKSEVHSCFSKSKDDYGILNSVRCDRKIICEDLIKEIDFSSKRPYFAEILYFMLKNDFDITKYLVNMSESKLNMNFTYISINYTDGKDLLEKYLRKIETSEDINNMIICKNLKNVLIIDNYFYGEKYKDEFASYIAIGQKVLQKVYNKDILEENNFYILRQDEDLFMAYMGLSEKYKEKDAKKYISYLGKALKAYPVMKKGIELLLNDFKNVEAEKTKQFNEYTLKVKDNIQKLIDCGEIKDAKLLLGELKKMNIDDEDIYSISAVISIMDNDLQSAQSVLKEGLVKYKESFDLNYNMAYICENSEDFYGAMVYYIRALKYCNDSDMSESIKSLIENIKNSDINNLNFKKYKMILLGNKSSIGQCQNNFPQYEVLAYVEDEKCKDTDKEENEYIIGDKISYCDIKKYNYDFIMITEGENKQDIIQKLKEVRISDNVYFYDNFKTSVIEGFEYKMQKLSHYKDVEAIVIGLSYAEVGIKEELLSMRTVNLALSAQDIYYDSKVMEYILQHSENYKNVKHVLINLAYYSFDYDITKTIAKYRIHRYMDYFCDYHNNSDKIGVHIARSSYENNITYDMYIKINDFKEQSLMKHNVPEEEYEAEKNATMDYRETRVENINALDEMLELLKSHNIKPIICVLPTSGCYRKYFENNIQKEKFYKIINELRNKFEFEIFDYFDSKSFNDEDFWDYSHLNKSGAEKFTKIINEKLNN